ncbi:hypothetical protein DEU56DRAFT_166676 [Suillus clintonianus]|uniref:uncharacterized protein n=1 Tax=Suillus clintonianus TaxID=1904413 RepID=UPI001B883586|nr:uncharacterized protein DEU56DRAFT_166676 [Suillus clintonianus]KAG2146202.1 hypothetical protein DEU56DRAFT_166676 [Suillus clintonianus]
MSPTVVKNLTFQTNDLGREVTLLLTFDAHTEGLEGEFNPKILKTGTFKQKGKCVMPVTYTNELAFGKAQAVTGRIVDAATLKTSQRTTLTENNGVLHFSTPETGADGFLQAVNKTGSVQDLAVGFLNEGGFGSGPTLRFKDVGDGSRVTALRTPILRAYITSDHQKTSVLAGAVDTPEIWAQNLDSLAESTTWNLKFNESTGQYTITPA